MAKKGEKIMQKKVCDINLKMEQNHSQCSSIGLISMCQLIKDLFYHIFSCYVGLVAQNTPKN